MTPEYPQLDNHKRTLGILFVIWGSLTFVGMLILTALLSFAFEIAMNEINDEDARILEKIGGILQYLPLVVIIFFSFPTLIAGIGLLNKKSWAMLLGVIVGCLKLPAFPIGTALGVYAIWIYYEEQRLKRM